LISVICAISGELCFSDPALTRDVGDHGDLNPTLPLSVN
jgi:hypothetical protein